MKTTLLRCMTAVLLCCFLAGFAQAEREGKKPSDSEYFRILLPKDREISVEISSKKLRAAAVPAELDKAEWVRSSRDSRSNAVLFEELEVPLKAPEGTERFPAACSLLLRRYEINNGRGILNWLRLGLVLKDKADNAWTYVFEVRTQTGRDLATAPTVDLSSLEDVTLEVVTKVRSGRDVGIGLRVAMGRSAVVDIRKQGQQKKTESVQAEIALTDEKGKPAHSQKGPLQQFGFG